jgi:hypothetical protein
MSAFYPYDEVQFDPPEWFAGLRSDAVEFWAAMVLGCLAVRFTLGPRRQRKMARRAARTIETCVRSIGGLSDWDMELLLRRLKMIADCPLPVAVEQLHAEYLTATAEDWPP